MFSYLLKGQCHEIFASGLFHESPSPKALKITIGSFQIFPTIRGDIRKSRCTTGINDTGGALEQRISPRFKKKIEMSLIGYSRAWGKLIHEKNL